MVACQKNTATPDAQSYLPTTFSGKMISYDVNGQKKDLKGVCTNSSVMELQGENCSIRYTGTHHTNGSTLCVELDHNGQHHTYNIEMVNTGTAGGHHGEGHHGGNGYTGTHHTDHSHWGAPTGEGFTNVQAYCFGNDTLYMCKGKGLLRFCSGKNTWQIQPTR